MARVARLCAIYAGTVASVCVLVSLTWWVDPSFGNRAGSAVLVIAFLSGLLGFFVMFAMLVSQLEARGLGPSAPPSLMLRGLKKIPRLVLVWFALVVVAAIISFGIAWGRAGQWEAAAPYSDLPSGCHWPLYANHDTEHLCVSHARWLDVKLQTAHIFVGFGVIFLTVDTLAFTILSRTPKAPQRPWRAPAPASGEPPYWPPPGRSPEA